MGFREHLHSVVDQVPGTLMCVLMDQAGIPVDSVQSAEGEARDVLAAAVEIPGLLLRVREALPGLKLGALSEIDLRGDTLVAVVRPLSDEHFVAALLLATANVAKARHLLRLSAPALAAELL